MLGVVLLLSTVGAQSLSGATPVSLLKWATGDPLTLVQLFAEAGVPAGLELREADHERLSATRRRWLPENWNRERFSQEETVSLEQVVAAFNASHTDYVAALDAGVVVIRPIFGRASYLETRSLSGRLTATGLMRIGEKIFAPLDPRLDAPGGRLVSRPGPIGTEVDYGDGLDVSIDTDGSTVTDVLNTIARKAPGHPWIVITADGDSPTVASFGFVHRHGVTSRLRIDAAP